MTLGEVRVGDELPGLAVAVTPALVVAGALATRDFQDVHHDHLRARELGSPDIFMNVHTTMGFVVRFVTDWAGPAARVRRTAIQLGVPSHPGDTLTFSGAVIAVADGLVEVRVAGRNRLGDHVTGTVAIALPGVPR